MYEMEEGFSPGGIGPGTVERVYTTKVTRGQIPEYGVMGFWFLAISYLETGSASKISTFTIHIYILLARSSFLVSI